MIIDDTPYPPRSTRAALSLHRLQPQLTDEQREQSIADAEAQAEALAFAQRIAAQVRKPGELTPLGVPRVA